MFNKLFSEMNLTPQIFLFWFSLVKVSGGWWWNSEEVNILKLTQTWLASNSVFIFSKFPRTSLHFIFSLWTDSRSQDSDPAEARRFEDYDYYDYGLERIGESDDYYYYYLDDDQYQYQHYPEDRSGQ